MSKQKNKKPVVILDLAGPQGNAFAVLGIVSAELKKHCGENIAKEYREKAMSGDYENLIEVTQQYVELEDTSGSY